MGPHKHATGLGQTDWQGTGGGPMMKGLVGRQPQPAPTLVLDTEARPQAWVQGRVQFCDDVAIGGDLDWEFAFFRALGVRPAETEGWYGHEA